MQVLLNPGVSKCRDLRRDRSSTRVPYVRFQMVGSCSSAQVHPPYYAEIELDPFVPYDVSLIYGKLANHLDGSGFARHRLCQGQGVRAAMFVVRPMSITRSSIESVHGDLCFYDVVFLFLTGGNIIVGDHRELLLYDNYLPSEINETGKFGCRALQVGRGYTQQSKTTSQSINRPILIPKQTLQKHKKSLLNHLETCKIHNEIIFRPRSWTLAADQPSVSPLCAPQPHTPFSLYPL
jgi:hypothetical protein